MWNNRNIWILLTGEFIAGMGLWTSIIANLEFMQQYIPSDFFKALIMMTGLLAGVLVGPLAGKVIDANHKKHILIAAGIGRMISVGFMFLALYFGSVLWMVVFMIGIQVSGAFYFPAIQSLIPIIARDDQLLSINGLHMNVVTLSRVLGTAVAGVMLTVMSLYDLYSASLIAYLFLLFSTFFLRVKEPELADRQYNKRDKTGFKDLNPLLKEMPIVVTLLVLTVIPTLFIASFNLMVINISELQGDPSIKGWIYSVEGIAFVIGTFVIKRVSANRDRVRLSFVFAALIAAAHLSLFFSDIKIFALASFGLFGLAAGCFFPLASTIFQTEVNKEYHGRFFSFRNMYDRVLFQFVLLGAGLLLDTIGMQQMSLVYGTLSLSLIFVFLLKQQKAHQQESNSVKM